MQYNVPLAKEKIEEIKRSVDIIDIIGSYLRLEKAGKNYRSLCPFHQEKTPSFMVNPQKQIFYCFGCGEGGDVIKFVMKYNQLSFYNALKLIARRAGIELSDKIFNRYPDQERKDIKKLYEINKTASMYYRSQLLNSSSAIHARNYLKKRGISEEVSHKFLLGYAPNAWSNLFNYLLKKGFRKEELLLSGLIAEGKNSKCYDRFRNRIVFPIFSKDGDIIGFGGRVLSSKDAPKYLNSPETLIFHKGKNLYGLHLVQKGHFSKTTVILVEGYFDVLKLYANGVINVVAPLGTALTPDQARILSYFTKNIVLLFDGDDAGMKAAHRATKTLLSFDIIPKIVLLPDGMDPDDFIDNSGVDALEEVINNALFALDFFIANRLDIKQNEMRGDPGASKEVYELFSLVESIDDPIKKASYVQKIAERLQLKEEAVWEAWEKFRRDKKGDMHVEPARLKERSLSSHELTKLEETILLLCIHYPETRPELKNLVDGDLFKNVNALRLAMILINDNEEELKNGTIEDERLTKIYHRLAVVGDPFSSMDVYSILSELKDRIGQIRVVKGLPQLTSKIKQAEKEGDLDTLRELLLEKQRLLSSLNSASYGR